MKSVINLEETILHKIKDLSHKRQQQVLDFIEFLLQQDSPPEKFQHPDGRPMSALEAAGDLVGSVDGGPGDLSTNKKYLQGPQFDETKSIIGHGAASISSEPSRSVS